MLLWAMAPAREPATSLSAMPNVSWLLPINRLICQTGHPFVTHQLDMWQKYVACWSCTVAYLFIRHELNCRLRGDFDDIDSVAPPQWPHTALADHLSKAPTDTHAVALGGVNLGRPRPGQTVCICSHWNHSSTSLCAVCLECHTPSSISWVLCFTCMRTLSLSSGAVQVRETAPAPPPATRCLHHIPVCFSSAVNSSGTIKLSPTSKIWGGSRGIKYVDTPPQ